MIFADVNADKLHEAHKLNLPCIYYSQITLLCYTIKVVMKLGFIMV